MKISELNRKIKKGELKVVDVLEKCLENIRKNEAEINAFITVDEEAARKRAEEIQQLIDEGRLDSSVAGVVIGVKDNICVEGMRTTCGSKILENFV